MRQSIASTYDSAESGLPYRVVTRLGANGHRSLSETPVADPFVRQRVVIGWRDALWMLLRDRRIILEVTVAARSEVVEDVMELDGQYLGRLDSTRRAGWNARIEGALTSIANKEPRP